jgi:predicted nucleic acid-binding protein
MYVLDTNTLIYYFKGQGKVAQNLAKVSAHEISIPTIVLFELQVGIAKSTFFGKLLYCGSEKNDLLLLERSHIC